MYSSQTVLLLLSDLLRFVSSFMFIPNKGCCIAWYLATLDRNKKIPRSTSIVLSPVNTIRHSEILTKFSLIRRVGETDTEDAQQLCGCSLVPDGCGNGGAPL